MRLRVCSLLLLFISLFIAAKGSTEGSPSIKLVSEDDSRKEENGCMPSDKPKPSDLPSDKPKPSDMSSDNQSQTHTIRQSESNNAKNVLIYNPYLGHHHIRFMTTIANQLLAEGHKVTMLDSKAMTKPREFTKTKGMKAPVVIKQCGVAEGIEKNQGTGLKPFWDDLSWTSKLSGLFNFYKLDISFSPLMSSQCSAILDSKEDMRTLKETKFDLAITEVFDFCGLGIFDILKPTKVILASSVPLHEFIGELLGLPKAFDIIPTKFSTKTMDSLRDKYGPFDSAGFVENAIGSAISGHTMFGSLEANETNIFKKYYSREGLGEFPGIKNLLKNAHSLMENVHPLLDLNKPTLNAIIPIGGITVQDIHTRLDEKDKKKLNTIKAEMTEAKKETKVVLVSFGTVMDKSTMKKEIIENIVKALQGVKEATFFWYIDDPELENELHKNNSNVKPKDWLPQEQLLASGKVDLFVSHMGIGSMTEGAYNGVPFVSVPLFVDQHYNYVCAKRLGIAKFVDKASLAESPAALRDAIREALKDGTMKGKSDELKNRLKKFGNQTKTMIDHINFILSLDENDPPLTFGHHHHGFTLSHSLRSLVHLAPYYAGPVAIVAILILCVIVAACLMLRSLLCCQWPLPLNQPFNGFVRTTWAFVFCCYIFFGFIYPACLYIADLYNQNNRYIFITAMVPILISLCVLNGFLFLNYRDVFWLCYEYSCYVAGVIFWFTLIALSVFALTIFVLYMRLFFVYHW